MRKAVLQLEALTCPSCIKKIKGTLDKITGVEEAKVLFNVSKTKIDFDETKVSSDEIKDIIEKLGYEVISVKVSS